MAREEQSDGNDGMQIDGCDSELLRSSEVPQCFNADYLKVYYGILIWRSLIDCQFVMIYFAVFVFLITCMLSRHSSGV